VTTDLPDLWRREAGLYRRDGVDSLARMAERHAAELDAALRAGGDAVLSAREAARVSGYSADHLHRLVKAGRLTDYGRAHAPRYRRADLPSKPGRSLPEKAQASNSGGATARQVLRAVANE
jgi:hypothetical protein